MASPLVSVIVPTFNYGHLIGHALRSLQEQTCTDWEAVVADDGSTDTTAHVVGELARRDTRIRYLPLPRHGVSRARNEAIRFSRGEFIQFLDADDMLEPAKLSFQADYLQRHPDVAIVYGDVRYFRTDHHDDRWFTMFGPGEPWMPGISGSGDLILGPLLEGNILAISSPLLRRTVLDNIGLFDEELGAVEDWDLWIRCAARGVRFEYVPAEGTLALVRTHPTSLSRDASKMAAGRGLLRRKIDNIIQDSHAFLSARQYAGRLWQKRVERLGLAIDTFVSVDQRFILIDQDMVKGQLSSGARAMPFMEQNGQYWGLPPDDDSALAELARQRDAGAGFVIIAWPSFWCLAYYPRFHERLRSQFNCLHHDDAAVVYDIRRPA